MAGFYDDYTDGGSGEQSSSFYGTDKEYSEAAALSAQSASNSATAASASATSAAASAAAAASDASEVAADVAAAEAAKLAAQAAQAAAELAETGAETAETNAETANTNAAYSANSASTSATNAANSASSAATSASNASTSASAAATSATDASTSASSAATSATSAATSAGTATTQATAAAASATSASNSATAAASSASAASTSATNAATSETNAATSAANASTSETNASASETAAAGSAASASTSASNAATSETSASNSASAASTSATNAAASETNAATSETNAAASASAASTSATNAAASESAAATSATSAATSASTATTQAGLASTSASNAATSETNAATSASNAASSATAAASSASSASTSASNAATSESNAASSATAAAGSASAASASADAALSALDNFDDRYLGQKTTAPTVDNDGDALVTGALYFDTTDDAMKVWDGTQWLAAYASLSGALIAVNNLSDLSDASAARTNLGLGTAATTNSTAYATAAQGTLADSALQSGDNISLLTNNSGYITGNQTITLSGDVSGSGTTSISVTIADDSHNHIISNVDGLQTALDGKVDDSQVLTNVPAGAVFTDTTYSVGNGGLTEINFTSALNSKLAGIEAGATADQTASEILTAVKTVDGSGSGLDADLLDGQQGSYYAAASSLGSYLPLSGGTLSGSLTTTSLTVSSTYNGILGPASFSWGGSTNYPTLYSSNQDRWVMHLNPHIAWTQNGQRGFTGVTRGSMVRFEGNLASSVSWDAGCLTSINTSGDHWGVARAEAWRFYLTSSGTAVSAAQGTLWGASNDGSGSGLDADTVDGYNTSTSSTANTVAVRDGSGHIYGNYILGSYFNASSGNSENPTIGQIWTQSTGDNYLRKSTPAHFASQMSQYLVQTDGSNPAYIKVPPNYTGNLNSIVNPGVYFTEGTGAISNNPFGTSGSFLQFGDAGGSDVRLQFYAKSSLDRIAFRNQWGLNNWGGWHEFWTTANDGSGSGLDADLLDGQHASAFKPDWYSTWAPVSKSQSVWYQMAYDGCIHVAVDVTVYYDVDIGNNTSSYTRFQYKANAGNGSRASAAIPLAKGQWYRVTPNYSSPVGSIYEQRLRG